MYSAPCYLASAAVSSFPSPITGSPHGTLLTREARRGPPKPNPTSSTSVSGTLSAEFCRRRSASARGESRNKPGSTKRGANPPSSCAGGIRRSRAACAASRGLGYRNNAASLGDAQSQMHNYRNLVLGFPSQRHLETEPCSPQRKQGPKKKKKKKKNHGPE
ncbi:hypothetical protein LZ31DRAFT_1963 [Colletotrichum somersetense]|nr:hypothetical protein LZ31DRAFT_1963 [Colletotrichum somersetense]